MKIYFTLLTAAFSVTWLSACGGFPKHPLEKDLGVDGIITSQYNNLALNPTAAALAFDGYIIGIEKIENEGRARADRGEPYAEVIDEIGKVERCPVIWPPFGPIDENRGLNCHYKEKVFNQVKTMAVTHIIAYEPPTASARYLYNIYASSNCPKKPCDDRQESSEFNDPIAEFHHLKDLVLDANGKPITPEVSQSGYFMDGISALKKTLQAELGEKIRAKLEDPDSRYTHLVLASAGWDNDQEVSVAHYNAVLSNVQQAARKEGKNFRPLFIGLTWPSVWGNDDWVLGLKHLFMKFIGYPNKANDADEIGYTIMNVLLNEVIADVKANPKHGDIPVVVFGHSFGARLTSRAVYSAHHLKGQDDQQESTVDLYIGLQPAFSINRFIKDDGREGAPYLPDKARGMPVVLTTSEHDTANPTAKLATGARHVGGIHGLEWAEKFKVGGSTADHRFMVFKEATANGRVDNTCKDWQETYDKDPNAVFVVDAKRFVRSHGDVVDLPAGRMIWDSIACFTEEREATK